VSDDKSSNKEYTADKITILEGLEAVRKRPAMYIGSTGKSGLHHLVYEVVDNSVDEAMGGYCNQIDVTLNKDGSVTVIDNGRGIPVDPHPIYKKSALEIVVTKLHAGGKFDKGSYVVSGGLHGVGISVVAALSKHMSVTVKKGGKIYQQEYKIGKPINDVKVIGSCEKSETGTTITFNPDETIFSVTAFDFSILQTRFREIAFLNKGLKITLIDEVNDKKEVFLYEGGLVEFVKWLNKSKEPLHPKPVYYIKEDSGMVIEVAVQYNSGYQENVLGFVNTINTVEGGTHVIGFKTALTRAINEYANKNSMIKGENLTGDDVREGLTAIISAKVPEPQFEGQTKTKLGNSDVKGIVDRVSMAALMEFFEENPPIAKRIVMKSLDAQRARNAAKKAKELIRRKSAFGSGGLPGKLTDCARKKSEDTELYLVEGDSAGGCFVGETKIALVDGRELNFLEIIKEAEEGKEHFCYTIGDDENISVEKIINPRKTKENAELVKITLDNGQEIKCTPDHRFMLRDGTYTQAKDLMSGQSLMPLYKKISKIGGRVKIEGYDMVINLKSSKWKFTHLLSDDWNVKNNIYPNNFGFHRHHSDFNKLNNNPTNIIRMLPEEHLRRHNEQIKRTLHTTEAKEKSRLVHKTEEFRKKISAISKKYGKMLSEKAKNQWKDKSLCEWRANKTSEQWTANFRNKRKETLPKTYYIKSMVLLKKLMDEKRLSEYDKVRIEENDKSRLKYNSLLIRYFNNDEKKLMSALETFNHKVVKVEFLQERSDVYDLEIPNTHNFALASGVFVHNSARQARNKDIQAILPLKGKPLNVEKASAVKVLSNEEITNLITAIGTNIGEQFNMEGLRYSKIILMSDADVDGSHIKTLLLTFFFRFMPKLIEEGHIYVAVPPLYRVRKRGDHYVYTDEELKELKKKLGDNAEVLRFKGLGEMNPEQLWDTTMNPKTRLLKKIVIEDAASADETFSRLMGDDVNARREFISERAKEAQIDI